MPTLRLNMGAESMPGCLIFPPGSTVSFKGGNLVMGVFLFHPHLPKTGGHFPPQGLRFTAAPLPKASSVGICSVSGRHIHCLHSAVVYEHGGVEEKKAETHKSAFSKYPHCAFSILQRKFSPQAQ